MRCLVSFDVGVLIRICREKEARKVCAVRREEEAVATILLMVIYIAFIGLGIPDSLFGAAWPAIYQELGLPLSYANFVTSLISCGTLASSLLSARLINRLGTGRVTVLSTWLTALALAGFSFSEQFIWFCLLAIPLGLGAGAIDAALNNYVAVNYKAAHMNFISCFYGVGVTVSPYLVSLALAGEGGWRGGYRTVFYIQLGIALLTLLALPLWGKVGGKRSAQTEPVRTISLKAMGKVSAVRLACLVFLGSCAVEFTCNAWGSTFLTAAKGMSAEQAAAMITVYYVGMTLSRFLSGVIVHRVEGWTLISVGQGVVLGGILLLAAPLPTGAAAAGLFLVGMGNGPIYPNLSYLTPQNFGADVSQSVMGMQMAAANVGILVMPFLFGLIAQAFGAWLFPYFLLAMLALMLAARILLTRRLRERGGMERIRE